MLLVARKAGRQAIAMQQCMEPVMKEVEVVAHASLFFDKLNLSSVNAQLRHAVVYRLAIFVVLREVAQPDLVAGRMLYTPHTFP